MNGTGAQGVKSTLIISLVFLGACSSRQKADLLAIKEMRSVAAEWVLVNREAARGRLLSPYERGMRDAARQDIAKQARTLSDQNSPAARHAAALQALPADAPPGLIAPHVTALKHIEIALEPA